MILSICEICKKLQFFVKRQKIKLPTGEMATSKKLMCKKCLRKVEQAIRPKNG